MTETHVFCCRCRSPITEDRTVLDIRCGPMYAAGRRTLDVCPSCLDRFMSDFLGAPAVRTRPAVELATA